METRGVITETIDNFVTNLEKTGAFRITGWFNEDVLMEDSTLDWIAKDSKELLAELTTGYMIGYLACATHSIVSDIRINKSLQVDE